MTVIDLTHTIREDMPVYPGTEPPRLTTACTVSQCGYRETLLHMYSHTGTHMDAPPPRRAGGPPRASGGAGRVWGRGGGGGGRGPARIPRDLPLRHEAALRDADFLLFCTGWDQYWGADAYYEGFPCLTEEAARFVAGLPLKGVGEDSISLDPCDTVDFPNHLTLFGAGLVNTENLKGLAQLIGREFTFLTMPLKFENADGCSCRAAAIVTKEA